MKKISFALLMTAFFINANAQQKPLMTSTTTTVQTDDLLLGKITLNDLLKNPYSLWYSPNHDSYKSNPSTISDLKKHLNDVKITIFMGTWCEDSQHLVPSFIKILEELSFDKQNITIIAMNREKKTTENFEKDLNISNIPTFIFYKNNKEVNRIVEYPKETLEKDMLKILSGQNYKHAYED